jgi:hypothetical protein
MLWRKTWGMVKPYTRNLERAGISTLILYADASLLKYCLF